ncbi:MAG: glycosyltransferase family 4 protein [Gemmatimonadales bacterium]|nr:glycosyltransferase family 4 protein [Gemmatimonadales bacterium]
MTSPRTVVLLTSVAGWRGSATSYHKIAVGMIASGWRVHALLGGEALRTRFEECGASVGVIGLRSTGLGAARMLARKFAEVDASVVITDTPRDFRVGVLARIFHRTPVVYRYNLSYRAAHQGIVERMYLRGGAGCVFQSRAIQDEFLAAYPSLRDHPRWLIPNGYDVPDEATDEAAARELGQRLTLDGGQPVVLCGAMLASRKGHDVLLEAVRRRRELGDSFTLVLCGTGGEAASIAESARALGVPAVFTGMLDAREMRAAFRLADVVVHPSEREIFPNVVAEAMMAGRAVVAVDSWGTAEVLGDAGVLVPPQDADALGAAIVRLLGDAGERERLGSAARERVRTMFPMERMVDGYRRVIEAVTAG